MGGPTLGERGASLLRELGSWAAVVGTEAPCTVAAFPATDRPVGTEAPVGPSAEGRAALGTDPPPSPGTEAPREAAGSDSDSSPISETGEPARATGELDSPMASGSRVGAGCASGGGFASADSWVVGGPTEVSTEGGGSCAGSSTSALIGGEAGGTDAAGTMAPTGAAFLTVLGGGRHAGAAAAAATGSLQSL